MTFISEQDMWTYKNINLYNFDFTFNVWGFIKFFFDVQEKDGKEVVRLEGEGGKEGVYVTILKSDGSSLYITRDIAAAIHR